MFLIDDELDINLVGGKGYNLVYFKQNTNLLIPNFKCVSSRFFENYKEDNEAKNILINELNGFLNKKKLYAVRSSAIDEDSKNNSFAGIHDSFLNVKADDVFNKIFDVYKSAYSERAIEYRKANNLNTKQIKMSVVIQEMVDAEYAGVINTINPITNNPDEITISVIEGLGENLVNGTEDGSTYLINGSNIKVIGKNVLNKKTISRLLKFTYEIIKITDRFQDIEFAIKDRKVYFLQTRDITVYKEVNPHEKILFIDNANIIESYFGQTSYLTYTFAKDVYKDVYTCTLKAGKVRKKILDSLNDSLSEMIYYYNGRVYYNMNSWYHVNTIFSFKKSTTYMETMMGVKSSASDFKKIKMNIFDKIKLALLFIHKVIKIDKLSNKFIDKFNKVVIPYYGKELNLNNEELKTLFHQIENDITKDFAVPIINDCAVMIFYGLLKEKVMKLKKITNKDDLIAKCISNDGNVESCGSCTNLEELAFKIKTNESLLNDFIILSDEELYKKYHNQESIIFDEIQNYIFKFGSRVTDELKLETVTMIEDNKIIYTLLKNIISNDVDEKQESFTNNDTIPRKLRFISKQARKYIQNRERLRLKRTYIYSVVRNIFLNFGRNFVNEGKIDNVNDIFYLTKQEVFNPKENLKSIINKRKEEEKENPKQPYYDRYVFYKNGTVLGVTNNIKTEGLTGIPSGAGIVTAPATIMNSNKDYLEKGNIIVTKRTDPGWISLFPLTSGLIVEHGSMLSHSFVVAREMGIPAIVGVSNATNIIKNDDLITLDGVRGVIKIENEKLLQK